jgi:hypothetical protein
MRRTTLWMVTTVAAVVLLFSYRTSLGGSVPSPAPAAAAPGIVPDGPAPSGSPPSGSPPSGSAPSGSAPSGSASRGRPGQRPPRTVTVNGTVAQTRWGPVQVQVQISGGRITGVKALQQPTGSDRDDEINGYALPQLRAEVLAAQSGRIDAVSGATVTSGGYRESLQAALDAANFG